MNSNFVFVKQHDSELFRILLSIENRVKIDPYGIGNDLRQVLELLCAKKIKEYGLYDALLDAARKRYRSTSALPTLADQLWNLRSAQFLRAAVPASVCKNPRPLPDFSVSDSYRGANGKPVLRFENAEKLSAEALEEYRKKYKRADAFLRQLGNDYSHSPNPYVTRVFKRTYENVLDALRCLQKYVWMYFGGNENNCPVFNEDIMPILNYEIRNAVVPTDVARGLCQKEFSATRYEEYREAPVGSSLIRQYLRTNTDSVFLRRAADVYLAADNCGSLLKQVSILSEGGRAERPFYIIAYDFRTEASKLNDAFLSSLSVGERLSLCLSYAKVMQSFHNNAVPIYHRVFNAGCAYYADERALGRGIATAIVKFEFAKISERNYQTVIGTDPRRALLVANDETRYLAPEWNAIERFDAKDWAKVDIYSLGILFTDILMGKIGGYTDREITRTPHMKPYLELIASMTDQKNARPDINEVCEYLKGVV